MNIITLIITLLLCGNVWAQNFSNGSVSSPQDQASSQSPGVADYISGAKRPQTKNQVFVMDDFSGGLNNKYNPIGLNNKEAQIAQNIRINTQLKSINKRAPILNYGTASSIYPILGLFRYYAYNGTKVLLSDYNNQIVTGNDATGIFTSILTLSLPSHKAQWLTWNNQAIMTDGYNSPVKYDGTSSSATYLGSPLAIDSGSGSSLSNGNYTYKVSCYTSNANGTGPYEFSFNVPSNVLISTGHSVNLSMIPQCPDDNFLGEPIIGRYIYRTKANGSTYYELTQIADKSTVTYTDSTADSSISTTYPVVGSSSTTESSPPLGILSLIFQGRLWIANNPAHPSRLYYSEISSQEMFLPTSYFDIRANDGDQITMLQPVLGILTVGKQNSIQKIFTQNNATGIPAADWTISDPFSFTGSVSPYSAQQTPIGLLYLGNNGIYNFDGNFSTLLSDQVTPVIKDISNSNFVNAWSAFYNNSYYLSYTSSSSGATSNNRVLVYDLISKSYEIDTSKIGTFTVERGGSDIEVLYAGDSSIGKVYSYTNGSRDIINKTQADFSGAFTNARYIPVSVGGDSQNATLEIANIATIDALVGTIDSLTGTIDRNSLTGSYISSPYTIGAVSYNDIYWNETIPSSGSSVTMAVRSAPTVDSVGNANWSAWSQEYSNPSGSNLSANLANNVIQYRISLTTDSYANSPTVYSSNNYVVDLSYNISQGSSENTIPFEWKSGWMDLNAPAYKKALKKIYVEYESSGIGTMNIQFNNWNSSGTQTNYNYNTPVNFSIDLTSHPSEFIEYFPNGEYDGELFSMDITESSLNQLKIKRIVLVYNIQPLI